MIKPDFLKRFLRTCGWGLGLSLEIVILASVALEPAEAETELVWHNCLTREVFTPDKQVWCDRWQTLQDGTFTVPTSLDPNPTFTTVALENGRYAQQDEQFIVELVNERGWLAFGDLDGDGQDDAAVIFGVALDPDGKAVATYLTAVLDVDGAAQALTPVRLGERIVLNAPIAIAENRIIIPFLTSTEVINRSYGIDTTLREMAKPVN